VKLRLFLDQNLRVETKDFLAGLGLDVISTRDLGMERAPDDGILAVARAQDRILITFNADFSDPRALASGHPGVIRLRIEPQTIEVVHPILERLFRTLSEERLRGALVTVTPVRVRIRHLRAQ
jgi:predicted nuclease of predicted toxin-antitoxin system